MSDGTDPGLTDARAGSALARLHAILEAHGIDTRYPPEVLDDVTRVSSAPGIDAPELLDETARPFVTIDNDGSRDLDQAMCIERAPDDGLRLHYALADASHFVRPGRPLYDEAMRRGVTYYLPGLAAPMLPRALSEGLVSLNPGVDRRALLMTIELDAGGEVKKTAFSRARIRSRRQLSYREVQAYFDHPSDRSLAGQPFSETLDLLREVGRRRIAHAEERDVIRYNRVETRAGIDPRDPDRFVVEARHRTEVEACNEQLSLLCNAEGARFLASPGRAPHITPIFRVHPRPDAERKEAFRALSWAVARAHALDDRTWAWQPGEALADYLARLPMSGLHARIAAALQRQAIMINRRSEFSAEPGLHHGVGADPYARFSSPMREMVGIFTHKEAIEKMTGAAPTGWPAAERRERDAVVELANRTKALQKRVAKAADLLILDQFLQEDLALPEAHRRRAGTVMGITPRKLYVQFDAPPFEVKVRLSDLESDEGVDLTTDEARARVDAVGGEARLRLGDRVVLQVQRKEGRRYVFRRIRDRPF